MMGKISEIAKSYNGQREISGNKGFINKDFEKKMRAIGFYTDAPWCGFFAMLVWKEAGEDISILSASSKKLIEKATAADNWHSVPVPGSVVVWASFKGGKRLGTGHIGIVTDVSENGIDYTTEEGNTTDKGGREGIQVATRYRQLTPEKWKVKDGMRLMGFVHPKS